MGFLFDRPDPQQAVPADLQQGRQQLIDAIFGGVTPMSFADWSRGQGPISGSIGNIARRYGGYQQYVTAQREAGAAGQTQNVLQALLGLTQDPGVNLEPLQAQFQQNLDYGLDAINASSPGRFSTANNYMQGQFTQRSLNDYNVLAANLLEQGRNRQLQAIMGLLGPVLGPTFGGPFTQGASPWENILGGAQTIAGIAGGVPSFGGIPFINPSL